MAIIPLRVYNREIEGMIDNGQLDEAVAHCRHILATFPKHIATYRLLGKTHLEQQRISDATDLFQRVLSAIPDDFISNVGMSIIREDENNLDASIWHMELAYEAQPSNIAIQDELRRLYGRREGTQPPKVRLTRGALSRMYAKGGLLDQAVAELRAAISEDPNRYDLQLLLASMYFQSSQRVEAVETCVNILKKLPFCLAANQILAVCLPEADLSGTGKNYRQVAISMDPYFAHAAQDTITSDQVPENAINIERLEWKSGIQMSEASAQPAWATSLGVSLDKKPDEVLPEWLIGTEAPISTEPSEKVQPSVSPFIWDTQEVEKIITDDNKAEGEIPDWMKDAGWRPASAEALQKPTEETIETPIIDIQPQEDLEKGTIPDWLRGIAPEGILSEEPSSTQPVEKDVSLPWLEKQQPGPTDSIIQWLEDAKPETPITAPKPEVPTAEISEEEVPDWLKDLDAAIPAAEPEEQHKDEISAIPSVPSAFTEGFVREEVITPKETIELPSAELQEEVEKIKPIPEIVETPPSEEMVETPPPALMVETPPPAEMVETPLPAEMVETPLPAEMVEKPPSADIFETEELPAAFADELPDWIKELAGEAPEAVSVTPPVQVPEMELPPITEEEPKVELPFPQEQVPPAESLVVHEEISAIEAPIGEDELKTVSPVDLGEQIQLEQPPGIDMEITEGISEVPGESDALNWLAGLEIEEDTHEEEQTAPGEEQREVPPEWASLETEAVSEAVVPELEPKAEELPILPDEEIPDWIKGLGETLEIETTPIEPISEISPESEAQPAEELPAWLFESAPAIEGKDVTVEAQETLGKEEELPDWIKEIATTIPTEEASIPPELAVTKKLPPLPFEPVSEWTPEEVPGSETGEEKPVEPPSQEPDWVSIIETPAQSELAEPVTAEVEVEAETEIAAEFEIEAAIEGVTEAEVEAETEIPSEVEIAAEVGVAIEGVPESEFVTEVEAETEIPSEVEGAAEVEAAIEGVPESEFAAEVEAETEIPADVEVATEAEVGTEVEAEVETVLAAPELPVMPAEESVEVELITLTDARNALNQGLPAQAAEVFTELIKHDHQIEEVIKEVQEALYRFPVDVNLWVVLGDAYFHIDEMQDALNAYSKAEDLVR